MAVLLTLLEQHLDKLPTTVAIQATIWWEVVIAHVKLQGCGLGMHPPVKVYACFTQHDHLVLLCCLCKLEGGPIFACMMQRGSNKLLHVYLWVLLICNPLPNYCAQMCVCIHITFMQTHLSLSIHAWMYPVVISCFCMYIV